MVSWGGWDGWMARAALLIWTNSVGFCSLPVAWLGLGALGPLTHMSGSQPADWHGRASSGDSCLCSMWSLILPQANPDFFFFTWQQHSKRERSKRKPKDPLQPRLHSPTTSFSLRYRGRGKDSFLMRGAARNLCLSAVYLLCSRAKSASGWWCHLGQPLCLLMPFFTLSDHLENKRHRLEHLWEPF